ncbi:MAG: DUF4962 domain-containing protein [Candidatus Ornithospirochaeta sp.]|nr:DUF4962 domain-containing protein [Candidatus Ornithospirochaeta sp.]
MEKKHIFVNDFRSLSSKTRQIERLRTECQRCMDTELPAVHPKKSTTYMGISIFNLALMYRISGDRRYFDEAMRWIDTVVSYPDWGNAHLVNLDLSAAWILFGLSIGYDWLRDEMDEEYRKKVSAKLSRHARLIYEYAVSHDRDSWPIEYWQNHNWIDFTGLAAAGYALEGEDDNAPIYRKAALDDFTRVFSLMADDGSNYEGVVYWRYGGMWLFVYAYLIREMEGIDFFSSSGYLQNTFYYKLYQSSGSLHMGIDHGDCHDHYSSNPVCVYYLYASVYRDGYAQTVGNKILSEFFETEAFESKVKPGLAPEAGLELVWYDPTVEEKPLLDLPLSRFFPDLGLVGIRESWDDGSSVFSFKCSSPGGKKQWEHGVKLYKEGIGSLCLSHNHPDNQSFFLMKGDDYLTLEDGYDRNIYPGSHNTILVDGQYTDAVDCNDAYMASVKLRLEKDPGYDISEYYGEIESYREEDGFVMLSSRNERIYPLSLEMEKVQRKVFSRRMDYIVIIDALRSRKEHRYTVINNSDVYPEGKDGAYFYREHGASYHVFSDKPISMSHEDVYVKSLMTSQEPDNYVERFIKSLRHTSISGEKEQVFVHVLSYRKGIEASFDGSLLRVSADGREDRFNIQSGCVTAELDGKEYEF